MDTKSLVLTLRSWGLSQNDIAIGAGVTQGTVSNLETGRSRSGTLRTHMALQDLHDRLKRQRTRAARVEAQEQANA